MRNNYTHDNATREGIALAHTVYGSPDAAKMRESSHGDSIGPATFSTAPYVPPKRRHRDNPEIELCAEDGCKAYPSDGYQYCAGHARSLGLLKGPKCQVDGCKAPPMKSTGWCYAHGEKQGLAHGDAG